MMNLYLITYVMCDDPEVLTERKESSSIVGAETDFQIANPDATILMTTEI